MSEPAGQRQGRAARLTRLMPAGPSTAARTPFVLLVVLLLGGGLITLLLLNSALNEGSFRLSELKKRTTELTDEQQALQRDVDASFEPDALARRARELGMVPGGSPAFLDPGGTVRGVPSKATPGPDPVPTPTTPAPATSAPASPATPTAPAATTPAPGTATAGPGTSTASGTPAAQPSTSPGR